MFTDTDWQPLHNQQGERIPGEETSRMVHWISDYDKPFTLILQRKKIKGQIELDLENGEDAERVKAGGHIYRAIATNRENMSNDQIIHWYA